MALSGTIQRDFASYFRLQIEWTATQSTSNNTSTITAKLYLISLSQYSTIQASASRRAWVGIEGTTNYSAYATNKISVSGNQKKLMHTYTRTVGHNSSGQLVADFTGGIDWDLNVNGWTGSTVTISGTGTLNTIPQTVEPPPIQKPPNVKITYPTTRVTVDDLIQLKWTSGPDPQGQALQYEIAYRNKSSQSWTYTSLFSNNNSTKTYNINTTSWVDSTTAQLAVRSRNSSGLYSAWQYTPDFTIKNAVPPLAATPIAPNSAGDYPPELNTRFSWQLNGGTGQSQYILEYRKAGVSTWTSTGWITSTRLYHDIAANTLTAGQYEWRIGHKGADGLSAPWSSYKQFEILAPTTAPVITKPVVNQVVNNNLIEVEWNAGTGQESYELRLLSGTGSVLFAETVNSKFGAGYITYNVVHGATYTVQVRNKKLGVWSPYASRIISATVALPDMVTTDPETLVTTDEERGSILLSYTPPVVKKNMLPSFTSGRWTGVTQGANTQAWNMLHQGTDIYIRIPAKPGQLYFGRVGLDAGYKITMATYNAANAIQGFVTSNAPTGGGIAEVSIMGTSTVTSIEIRIIRDTGLAGGYIYNPMVSEEYVPFEQGVDAGFTNPSEIQIWRRQFGQDEWTVIAKNVSMTVGGYEDLTVGSGLLYEYTIVTVGTNGLINSIPVFEAQVRFEHAFLHDAYDPNIFFRIFLEDAREEELDVEGELKFFAGRALPIREYGVHETHLIDIDWEIDSSEELMDIKAQIRKRNPLLYRDNTGRRMYATTNGVKVKDKQLYGHEMTMQLTETDFKEGVI